MSSLFCLLYYIYYLIGEKYKNNPIKKIITINKKVKINPFTNISEQMRIRSLSIQIFKNYIPQE